MMDGATFKIYGNAFVFVLCHRWNLCFIAIARCLAVRENSFVFKHSVTFYSSLEWLFLVWFKNFMFTVRNWKNGKMSPHQSVCVLFSFDNIVAEKNALEALREHLFKWTRYANKTIKDAMEKKCFDEASGHVKQVQRLSTSKRWYPSNDKKALKCYSFASWKFSSKHNATASDALWHYDSRFAVTLHSLKKCIFKVF